MDKEKMENVNEELKKEDIVNEEANEKENEAENVGSADDADSEDNADCKDEDNEKEDFEAMLAGKDDEIAALKDKLLRTIAEFDNYKKRTLKEKTELVLNGSEKAVCAVLPVLDDFERALATNCEDATAMKEGVQLIYTKFVKILESLGVKKIETEDMDFNVDYHEAVAMVPGMGDDKKGKIIDCLQTGYQLNDKVIRHSKVAVGQ